jgi:hypothetical protein
MEQRLLSNKESAEAGFAVGVMIELFTRLIAGDINFTEEQYEKISKASEILNRYDEAEQLELINTGLYWSVN